MSKKFFIWLIVGIIAIQLSMALVSNNGTKANELSMGVMLQEVKSGKLKPTEISATQAFPSWSSVKAVEGQNTFVATGKLTDENLETLRAFGPTESFQIPSVFWSILGSFLPLLLILGVLIFFMTRAGKKNPIFSHGKMNLKNQKKPDVKFKDVAGCDEAKEEVQEIVEFLKDPKKFQAMGGKIPAGLLLVGPPGTGKTLLAQAVAGEAECPFLSLSGSDFVEMLVGVGASRVRDLFEQARKQAPCIIFIDEIDGVGRSRGGANSNGGQDEREQTLNALLVEMQGFNGTEGIIVIGATNRASILDEALLRPGRFDRQITVDLPDLKGREAILNVYAPKFKLDPSVLLQEVAKGSTGFSGADLKNLLNEAAIHAARKNKTTISMPDIEEAKEKIRWGRERKRAMDATDKRIIAVHEAGHAIAQAALGSKDLLVHKVTIIPRGQSLGSTMFIPQKDHLNYSKEQLEQQLVCAMGGRVAEELLLGNITSGAYGDIKSATNIAHHMVYEYGMSPIGFRNVSTLHEGASPSTLNRADAEVDVILNAQLLRTREILSKHKVELEALTEELLRVETVDGKFVYDLVQVKPPAEDAPSIKA